MIESVRPMQAERKKKYSVIFLVEVPSRNAASGAPPDVHRRMPVRSALPLRKRRGSRSPIIGICVLQRADTQTSPACRCTAGCTLHQCRVPGAATAPLPGMRSIRTVGDTGGTPLAALRRGRWESRRTSSRCPTSIGSARRACHSSVHRQWHHAPLSQLRSSCRRHRG